MQRGLLILVATCVCMVAGYSSLNVKTADKEYLAKQKAVYSLFWHPDQPTTVSPDLYQIARSWSIEEHIVDFTNQTVVHDFVHLYKHGLLHRHVVFSIFHPEHLAEAEALFNLFYYAKDFDTFYKTAVWAHFNVNEKLFSYVLAVAVMHRPDTKHVQLPPFHELFPHFFFNNEVIQAAYRAKMGDDSLKKSIGIKYHDGGDVIIHANYSGWYLNNDAMAEEKLSYFTEDVSLNFYYFLFSHDFPFWMKSEKYHLLKEIRGEVYYFGHKQLLARYYLERLSNDLGEIEAFDWHEPIGPGYYPTINHPNGLPFPHRHSFSRIPVHKYDLVHDIEELETRIAFTIDAGVIMDPSSPSKEISIYTPEGLTLLGNLIQGNMDSINPKFYGSYDHIARSILGFEHVSIDKNHIAPSALEIFSTNLRDPIFYRLYKRIVNYFLKYKEYLPKYTHDEIVFPGVKIDSVSIDPLVTYFEDFDSVISNGIPVSSRSDAESTVIKVRQERLNHKPYTYHFTVSSDKNVKGIVRIFLGPKYDVHGHEIHFVKNWVNFIEIDQWVVDLKIGSNKFERNSHESKYVVPDMPTSDSVWKKLVAASEGNDTYTYNTQVYGFPDRLVLPKGKKEGLPLQFFVHVGQYDEAHTFQTDSPIWGSDVVELKPLGWPLDKPVDSHVFNVPNVYFKDVVVFHKHVDELNMTI